MKLYDTQKKKTYRESVNVEDGEMVGRALRTIRAVKPVCVLPWWIFVKTLKTQY